MAKKQKIQRVRCKTCGRTTNLLPSFLLAQKRFKVSVLEELIRLRLNHPKDWIKSPHLQVELSTAYDWLRCFKKQIPHGLSFLREKLLTLQPNTSVAAQSAPNGLMSDVELFKQFLNVAQLLHQTTLALANQQQPQNTNLFSFLNYFLAQHTGKALLEN